MGPWLCQTVRWPWNRGRKGGSGVDSRLITNSPAKLAIPPSPLFGMLLGTLLNKVGEFTIPNILYVSEK